MRLKAFIMLLVLCGVSMCLRAQESKTLWDARLKMFVYEYVEKPPAYPGGETALAQYLTKIRYPKEQDDLQSKINLSFVVDTMGNLLDKCIVNKDTSVYSLLDKEGMSLLNKMVRWIPGEQDGKKVAVRYYLPVRICLLQEE